MITPLIEYYLLSPLLVILVKKNWKLVFVFAAFIHLFMISRAYISHLGNPQDVNQIFWPLSIELLPSYAFYEYLLYFVIGIIIGFHLTGIREWLNKIRWLFLGIMIVSAILAVVEAEYIFQFTGDTIWRSVTLSLPTFIYIISFIFTFISFENFSPRPLNWFYRLGSYSLGIYLIQADVV